MNRVIEYIFTKEDEGLKIHEFLRHRGYTGSSIKELRLGKSFVLLDGKPARMIDTMKSGQKLSVNIIEEDNSAKIPPVDLPFDVIYEDEDLVVVNKPSGMPSHPSLNNYENTLGNAAMFYYQKKGCDFVFRCINRLDKDTTGLVIIAKNSVSCGILNDARKAGKITREYVAIVEGTPWPECGTIDRPIGRESDSAIKRRVDYENGERAVTHYEVLSTDGELSLVRFKLETGRTHQIRVHMSDAGHPLIGDFLYNPGDVRMRRQALHAEKLMFEQPITGEKLILTAPMPKDMQEVASNMLSKKGN